MKKRDIEFLFEIGTLRFIQRTWRQFLTPDFANLTEHTLRTIWIAAMIAKNEKRIDLEKIIKMALLHDLAESRTGDAHYLAGKYTERKEGQALEEILKDTSFEGDFLSLWEEFEEEKTIEAKIVKDADNLDVDLELNEQRARGNTLAEKKIIFRKTKIRNKFNTKTAKKLWDAFYRADVDDWHLKAQNKFNKNVKAP